MESDFNSFILSFIITDFFFVLHRHLHIPIVTNLVFTWHTLIQTCGGISCVQDEDSEVLLARCLDTSDAREVRELRREESPWHEVDGHEGQKPQLNPQRRIDVYYIYIYMYIYIYTRLFGIGRDGRVIYHPSRLTIAF